MTSYLTFITDNLTFGVETDQVIEIITNYKIRSVPKVPDYIPGIINLRGQIIPIMDMRLRLGKEGTPYSDSTCIIILNISEQLMGLVVDSVLQVQDLDDNTISPLPTPKEDEPAKNLMTLKDGSVALLLESEKLVCSI
ncbi:purine-binding chemotaxis protein CheW [Aequitasia blattaphilus]|uniref:Chemotaxis protein CheW n=1 Tax=Aequitasia blattaphilus TaxID=2949332 RepID=A0ABT1E9I3_9FIRM|nr:chemotaxis protein CheW [Aequitasia blattaphilus]MCP1102493.1 chemotaxis protein CheW [Aequitasia blattaphilus]MCR8615133.1 chemotaxis protein CheW [Aequitasia blattaphilus]